jgi:hypothetical protein
MTKQLTQEELSYLQSLRTEYTKAKMELADIELAKYEQFAKIDTIKSQFKANEELLVSKYGENAVINIQTGEVKEKE